MQQGDVILYQSNDDGEVEVVGGLITMDGGLQTSAYLSLFGGNEDDAGGSDESLSYWGNLDETETNKQYRSETQHLLQSIPVITSNLLKLKEAANRDLAWMIDDNIATEIEVTVTMPALNTVKISINIDADETIEFIENWKASV